MSFFVHDKAICESKVVGEGTRIWGFSHVMPGAHIGKNCNIGEHVFIENNVSVGNGCTIKNGVALWDQLTLEDDVFVGPFAVFTNDLKPRAFIKMEAGSLMPTILRRGATIGANATIVCGVTIGEYAMVGSGSVVVSDIPSHALVVGNPARIISRLCYCGERLDPNEYCHRCQKRLGENSQSAVIESFKKENHGN